MSADHTQTPENEHERIVTALQHAESVLEGIFDGIAVIVDGHSVYVNPSLGKMLGYKTQELIGVQPERFLAPRARPRDRERMKTLLESVEPDLSSAELTGAPEERYDLSARDDRATHPGRRRAGSATHAP